MGVRPLAPGWSRVLVQPQPASLAWAQAKVPTIRGPVRARFENTPERFRLELRLPANTSARVALPLGSRRSRRGVAVWMDGRRVSSRTEGGFAVVDPVGAGAHVFELR